MAQAQLSPMRMKVKDVIAKSRGTKFEGVKEKHYPVMVNKAEMGALNAMKKPIHERKKGGFIDQMVKKGLNEETYIMKGTEPKAVATAKKDVVPTMIEMDKSVSVGDMRSAGLDYSNSGSGSGGGGGGSPGGNESHNSRMSRLLGVQRAFDAYKAGEAARNKAAADQALKEQRESDRQKYVDEFKGYKDRFKSLEDQYDLSAERDAVRGLASESQALGDLYRTQMSGLGSRVGGYEGDVAGLRSGVDTLRQQQAGIGTQIGDLATQAMDPTSSPVYDQNRRMWAGVAEQQRSASNKAALEQLNRSAVGSGMSPQQLAMMRAQITSGQGAQARQDALSSGMAAQQMTSQQLAQGAGLLGQQAGLGMQQANLYGQQAGLGAQAAGLAGQQAGMFGQQAGFLSGTLGQRAGLQGQSAELLRQQLQGRAGMLGGQVGMTEYGLQDTVARANEALQLEMADKAQAANLAAARASGGGGGGGGILSGIFSGMGL